MLKGIFFLTSNDFQVKTSPSDENEKLLCIKNDESTMQLREGLTLILFYSNNCSYCDNLISEYKRLPTNLLGVNYGMINLNNHPNVVNMSNESISPIKYVPMLTLYLHGLPYVEYEGENTLEAIKAFILKISEKLNTVTSFTNTNVSREYDEKPSLYGDDTVETKSTSQQNTSIHHTMGKPYTKKKKNVCYMKEGQIVCT